MSNGSCTELPPGAKDFLVLRYPSEYLLVLGKWGSIAPLDRGRIVSYDRNMGSIAKVQNYLGLTDFAPFPTNGSVVSVNVWRGMIRDDFCQWLAKWEKKSLRVHLVFTVCAQFDEMGWCGDFNYVYSVLASRFEAKMERQGNWGIITIICGGRPC